MPEHPILFLSNSGLDTETASELKRRLLASPDAKAAGLEIWFDKDDLLPGQGWQVGKGHCNPLHCFCRDRRYQGRRQLGRPRGASRAEPHDRGKNYPFIPVPFIVSARPHADRLGSTRHRDTQLPLNSMIRMDPHDPIFHCAVWELSAIFCLRAARTDCRVRA